MIDIYITAKSHYSTYVFYVDIYGNRVNWASKST